MPVFDGLQQIVGCVVDTFDDIGIALSVGSPLNNDFVKSMNFFEFAEIGQREYLRLESFEQNIPNILADFLNMSHGGLRPLENVVGTLSLVGSDEVRIVNAGKRLHLFHLFCNLKLEGWL